MASVVSGALIVDEPCAKAQAIWNTLHDFLVSHGWGDSFEDYRARAEDLILIARLLRGSPGSVGAMLRSEFEACEDIHGRVILGLLLMTQRPLGEDTLFQRLGGGTGDLERLYLTVLLRMPEDLLPNEDEAKVLELWRHVLYAMTITQNQVETLARNESEGRWPFASRFGAQEPNTAVKSDRPRLSPEDMTQWRSPEWFVSRSAAERLKSLAVAETDGWIRYQMFSALQTAAVNHNHEVALWLADRFWAEYSPESNAWGALVYGVVYEFGPHDGTRQVFSWLHDGEGRLTPSNKRLLLDAVSGVHGDAAWPDVERGFKELRDPELKVALIESYFDWSDKRPRHAGLDFLRQQALDGELPMRRAALSQIVSGPRRFAELPGLREVILAALQDPSPVIRALGAGGIEVFNIREAVPLLISMAQSTQDHDEQGSVSDALRKLDPQAWSRIDWRPIPSPLDSDAASSGESDDDDDE